MSPPSSRARQVRLSIAAAVCLAPLLLFRGSAAQNLILNPSFEEVKPKDLAGLVFAKWGGWKYEGECQFEVGAVAHTGKMSALLSCAGPGKIRITQPQKLVAGRYRITAELRGLDIGTGQWNSTTEFMFDNKYFPLSKNGTFGWTQLTYVADLHETANTGPSFGLWAPGMFWIDDVSMEQVGSDIAVTPTPVLGREESPIQPPVSIAEGEVRCPRCGYRNARRADHCYACGADLHSTAEAPDRGSPVRAIASFSSGNPFANSTVTSLHAPTGQKSIRIDRGYAIMEAPQDWSGYDVLKIETFTDASGPVPIGIEIQDSGTHDYWTRVNRNGAILPGSGSLVIPLSQLYVGEKSRPGRKLFLNSITRLVFSIGDSPAPVFLSNMRLERDTEKRTVFFEGLYAFDFGTGSSPKMDGFTEITPATTYSAGRGYGLKNAKIWRAFDALQPDPLYQDFICIESGGLTVDLPNGRYRVIVNMDSPGGFWGEVQAFRERAVFAQGRKVVAETMNYKSFARKYFQFEAKDDLPFENTFDKYDAAHFSPKTFDVNVTDGQLQIGFSGQNWAASVSSVIVFPVAKAAEGERFLNWVKEKRRFYFDSYFQRVLHAATGDALAPTPEQTRRGYVLFARDFMEDVYYNDTPRSGETEKPLEGAAFAGENKPLVLSVVPLRDLGTGTVSAGALTGPGGSIPATAIDAGYVSYRLSRMTTDGAVYTIAPRYIEPNRSVALRQGITRQYWFDIHIPKSTAPGMYTGTVTFHSDNGAQQNIPIHLTVLKGHLDPLDIPAGPFGVQIGIPWLSDDRETVLYAADMTEKSVHAMRQYGFTMFSGVPTVGYNGFVAGKPQLDFAAADKQMKVARELGFLAVSSYGAGVSGLDAYHQDTAKMKAAGYSDYADFIKSIYSAIESHAREKEWLPVYWNLCDEPGGDDLDAAIENAQAYRRAFPAGPPFFTGATSLYDDSETSKTFTLARALTVPAVGLFSETGIKLLTRSGGRWAFYNGANRWNFGPYLYKAAKQFHGVYRLAWHWNAAAGDPYYALDSREDDTAWANATASGELVYSLEFMRLAAGVTDYQYLLTLDQLASAKPESLAAAHARDVIQRLLASFTLNDRQRSLRPGEWDVLRKTLSDAIVAFQ